MGLFDSVWFTCPACGTHSLEAQSKASECDMSRYEPEAVPRVIAADIIGKRLLCWSCGAYWQVEADVAIPETVGMHVEPCEAEPEAWEVRNAEQRKRAAEGAFRDLPDHLRPHAPSLACSVCGRQSWGGEAVGSLCNMPQPNGSRCKGVFQDGGPR